MHELDGVWLKVRRGRHHMKESGRLIKAFYKAKPYSVRVEIDPQSGDKAWVVNGNVKTPPLRLSMVVGDSIHNFRSALDHLAYALVLNNGCKPTKMTAFPICIDPKSWSGAQAKLAGMSDWAKTIIHDEQPCFSSHNHRKQMYTWLEELDIVDKHRHIQLTNEATSGGLWSQGLPSGSVDSTFIHFGAIQNNTILARVPKSYAYVDFHSAAEVAFGQGSTAEGQFVYITLYRFGFLVQHSINLFGCFPPTTTPKLHRFGVL